MHWLDMLKVRDLMHAQVGAREADDPRAPDAAPSSAALALPAPEARTRRPPALPPVSVAGDDSLRRACILMSEHGLERLLVTHRAWPVGTISAIDVVRYLASGAGL